MSKEFLKLIHLHEAVEMLLDSLPGPVGDVEEVALSGALGRVAAADIPSPVDLPGFDRSSMDGYAVRAADTFGASEGMPGYLTLTGEVMMGRPAGIAVGSGEAIRISTGGIVPEGADAVVMVENTQLDAETIEVSKPVAPGDNIIRSDEDVSTGSVLVKAGEELRPRHLGALAGVGFSDVTVYARPVVGIISTGDEVVAPGEEPGPGQVRDINSTALAACCEQAGCEPRLYGIIPDDFDRLLEAGREALDSCDALLISGGSSAGVRDMTLDVLAALGSPGVLAHGLYFKPGKPTLIAVCDGKPAIGLPGNPASAIAVFHEVLDPAFARLRGRAPGPGDFVPRRLSAEIDRSVSSPPGRMELVPVALEEVDGRWIASPILGKANLIGTLIRADGYVRVPLGFEGLEKGQQVTVELLE